MAGVQRTRGSGVRLSYSIDVHTSAAAPHIDTPKISYDLACRFYNSFGLTDDDVPYVSDTHDSIDIPQLLARTTDGQ